MGFDFTEMRRSYRDGEGGNVTETHLGLWEELPFAFDPGKTIRNAPVERNIAAFIAADPTLEPVLNVISSHDDLRESFGRLCAAEGHHLEDFGKMMEGEGAVSAAQFRDMMNNPAMREHLIQVMDHTAESEDVSVNEMTDYLRAASLAARNPSQENIQAWMAEGEEFGLEPDALREVQQGMAAGGFNLNSFLRNPSRALLDMGLDPQLVAALEPLIRFFTEALNYYMNGTPGQPGLSQIFGSMVEGSGPATAQLLAREGMVEERDDVGEIVINERGVKMRVYDVPAGLDQSVDLDSSAHGRQVHADLDGDGQREIVTVVGDRAYAPATQSQIEEFTSAAPGSGNVPRTINLGRAFVDAVDDVQTAAREPALRQTGAAAEFSSGVTAAAPGVP